MTRRHVGAETNRERDRLDEQTQHLDNENQRHDEGGSSRRSRHVLDVLDRSLLQQGHDDD